MFPYSLFYVYFDQYFNIRGIAVNSFLLSCAVVYFILLAIKNVQTAMIVFVCVFSITIDLVGSCYFFNVVVPGNDLK